MPFIADSVLDAALQKIVLDTTHLHIAPSIPASYSALMSSTLGNKALSGGMIQPPTDGATSGRRVTVMAITDGAVTANGNAGCWVLVRSNNSTILAAGELSATQAVTSGNTFTLSQFDITIPDAA